MNGLRFTAATALDADALTALWNRAYEGYFVPLCFDRAMLQRHVHRAGVDIALSCLLWRDDRPCGVSLGARRGARGYVAGFGIVMSARRQGLAGALIRQQLQRLAEDGARTVQLEVIEQNPARDVYRTAGFSDRRRLLLLEGSLVGVVGETALVPLDGEALAAAHARTHAARPTWRREAATVLDDLACGGVDAVGLPGGDGMLAHACVVDAGEQATLLDAAAVDEPAARRLLAALALRWPGRRWRLVDEPEDSPLSRAGQACGLHASLCQMEMVRE